MATNLVEAVRRTVCADGPADKRAARAAELIRTRSGRRWVGIYRVTSGNVENLAWSGPGPPAHPKFPINQGLTGAAIGTRTTVVSNDAARDPRFTNQESTGSELIVPVLLDGTVVGTLDVEDPATGAFDATDRRLFEDLAAALTGLYS